MVAVQVGVDDELDRLRGELLDRRGDFLAQRRELRVDHEDAIGADQDADRSALAVERVELVGHLVGFDLDLAEILPALCVCDGRRQHEGAEGEDESNGFHGELQLD